jgi:hypothetical protein
MFREGMLAFLTDEELESLSIEQSVFHIVGPNCGAIRH